MGKPSGSQAQFDQSSTTPKADQSGISKINHFSHPHPLQLSNLQPQQGFNTINPLSCSGCKNEASGVVYTCTICNYFLHQKCSEMPEKITHPFDKDNHILSLLPKPAYPEGLFNCDACGKQGNGFSYHCEICSIDLHILCASMPMDFTHHSHHHQLNLTFSSPYPNNTFSCDLCKMPGKNNWLYRCSICEFDIHLTCVNSESPLIYRPTIQQPSSVMNQMKSIMSNAFPQTTLNKTTIPNNFTNNNVNPSGFNAFRPTGGLAPQIHLQPQPFVANPMQQPFVAPQIHLQPQLQPQSFVATPMQQSFAPPNNFMNNGYGRQQNTMASQIAGGVANGIASGVSQAAAQALIQGMFGGGGNDMNQADQGTYFVSDGGYGGGEANTNYM